MQRNGDLTLNMPQVAQGPEHVIAAGARDGAFREQLQCIEQGCPDVSAGPVNLALGIRPCHDYHLDLLV